MAQSPLTVPPLSTTTPALDFEVLLSRDLQDHRPARVTRMVPQEKFTQTTATVAASELTLDLYQVSSQMHGDFRQLSERKAER